VLTLTSMYSALPSYNKIIVNSSMN